MGGIDLRLIALCYAGFTSSFLFLISLAIWISVAAPDIRLATAAYLFGAMAWCVGPFSLAFVLPRFGIHMPESVAAANAWLVLSSPIIAAFHLAAGLNSWAQLSYIVGRMIALQLLGAGFLTIGAIARLRLAQRTLVSGDQRARGRQARRPVWRFGIALPSEARDHAGRWARVPSESPPLPCAGGWLGDTPSRTSIGWLAAGGGPRRRPARPRD